MITYIDGRWFGEHGIGRFAREVNARLKLNHADLPLRPTHPLDALGVTRWLLKHDADNLFSPGYNAPIAFFNRYAFVIHDLNHIDVPHNSGALKRLYYRLVMRRACKRAAAVMTVSHFTAARLSKWADVPLEKIVVVGNGVSSEFCREGDSHDEGFPYYFAVGNRKGHKNEVRIINSFARIAEKINMMVIFTGEPSPQLTAQIKLHDLESRIKFVGRLDEAKLASYYRGAVAVVFPSLYEGFGLPVVESMACGTAVITSNTTSLPEVAGNAALLINPNSEDEISSAMLQVAVDADLRSALVKKGLTQAAKFTWDAVAQRVSTALS